MDKKHFFACESSNTHCAFMHSTKCGSITTDYAALDKLLHLREPQFPLLWNENNYIFLTYLWRLNKW